uniref:Uncharacterized protein n=1 Tax=viral metagenome TaxID=1070528 RepID=A0A6C0JQE8_9ZZZZ
MEEQSVHDIYVDVDAFITKTNTYTKTMFKGTLEEQHKNVTEFVKLLVDELPNKLDLKKYQEVYENKFQCDHINKLCKFICYWFRYTNHLKTYYEKFHSKTFKTNDEFLEFLLTENQLQTIRDDIKKINKKTEYLNSVTNNENLKKEMFKKIDKYMIDQIKKEIFNNGLTNDQLYIKYLFDAFESIVDEETM